MRRQPILLPGLIIISLFFSSIMQAQSSYDDYTFSDKTFEYREDFDNNSVFWDTDEANRRTAKVNDGVLVFTSLNDKTQVKYKTLNLDWDSDWELEIAVKWLEGKESSAMDFIWDKAPNNSTKYHFGFTASGKYVLSEYKNDSYNHILNFTPSSFVHRGLPNILTIRKVGQTYYFFVNRNLVKSMPYKPVKGDMIGFTVPPNTSIEVHRLYAYSLNKKSESYTSANRKSLPAGENFLGVMSKYNGYSLQIWRRRDNFPKDEIKAEWDNDYYVSDLSYDNNRWSLVMSKGTGFTNQTWITRKEWPKDLIKEKWGEGYYITELTHGNGVWAVVFSKGSDYTRQRWSTNGDDFPSNKISEYADENIWITEIIYGADRWALVGSKNDKIRAQKWFRTDELPTDEIQAYQDQGYTITQLSYEKEQWVLVMTQFTNRRPQEWFATTSFPNDEIRKYWDEGYYITDITYGNTSSDTQSTATQDFTESKIPSEKFSQLDGLLTGKWFGGGKDDTDREKGYMIFKEDRTTTMIINGDIIGGSNYEVEGTKIDLSYEIDQTTSPVNLDLVFKVEGTEYGRMKGIIKFIDEDTFQLQLASEIEDPRPTGFSSGPNDVAIFERVK